MNAVIEHGATVRIEYTLRDEAGTILDTSRGREPLTYVHGQHQIIPGLERELEGLQAGDARQVTVPPEDAYGPRDPGAVAEVPRAVVPPDALVPGVELLARGPDGSSRVVRIAEVREDTVLLDLNHPLAGKTLVFDIRVVEVSPPPWR